MIISDIFLSMSDEPINSNSSPYETLLSLGLISKPAINNYKDLDLVEIDVCSTVITRIIIEEREIE